MSSSCLTFTFDPPMANAKKIRLDMIEFPMTWSYFDNEMFMFEEGSCSSDILQFPINGRQTVETLTKVLRDGMNSVGKYEYSVELNQHRIRIRSAQPFQIMFGKMSLGLKYLLCGVFNEKPEYHEYEFTPQLGFRNNIEHLVLCFVINEEVLIKHCYCYDCMQTFISYQTVRYTQNLPFYEKDKLSDKERGRFPTDEKTSFNVQCHNDILLTEELLPIRTLRVYANNMFGHLIDFSKDDIQFTLQ